MILLLGITFVTYTHFAYAPVVAHLEKQIEQTIPSENKAKNTVAVLAFGDMMLDRAVRRHMNESGLEYPFALIKDFLKEGNDIVVANAEGPFTHFESKTVGILKNGPLEFTFATDTLPVLKETGFTLLSQANNHSINFEREGLEESERSIDESGMNWFGDPSNIGDSSYSTTTNGIKIAFVGFHEFAGQGFSATLDVIKKYKEAGAFVVVYPHWGTEYEPLFNENQEEMGYLFIDVGADVVFGAHPHVIEPIEVYKNKVIFYSLGNFIFDQSWSRATSEGLAVKMTVSSTSVAYKLYPLGIEKSQASIMVSEKAIPLLERLKTISMVPEMNIDSLGSGIFTLSR
jgi:poly-gamma-glutamate synthesis protein (capsule biosynthesis protein)